ncbi:MAG: NAD-dependent epimerase/dehydratase family protein [Planctomycetota bacterium]|nr:MAG: NAD-dependent epimerase/dehydratase family protein [Planctomycetota bacterium]
MTSLAVTGATGFLGRHVVRAAVDRGLAVRCLVRPTSDVVALRDFLGSTRWAAVECRVCNLADGASCRSAIRGAGCVVHLAAALRGSTPALFLNTVVPTRVLCRALAEERVPRFVLVSSLAVYGTARMTPGSELDENSPVDPQPHERDPYTYSKVVQERVAREQLAASDTQLVVLRPGVIIGPGRGALSDRIGLKIGSWRLRVTGRRPLPYTYVENCAEAVVQAAVVPLEKDVVCNVLDDRLPTPREVLRACRRAGKQVRTLPVPGWLMHRLCRWYHRYAEWSTRQLPPVLTEYRSRAAWNPLRFTNRRAKQWLQWGPRVPMDEALRRSLAEG